MKSDELSVRARAARWIFGGTAVLIGLILVIQFAIVVPHLIRQTGVSFAYSYLVAMAFCLITTLVAYKYLPRSLDKATYLYIGGMTLALMSMIFQDRLRNPGADRFSNGIFGLDIGVFILGILLGWKPAAVFTGITSVITFAIAVQFYDDAMLSVPIIFFAGLMILPSWLVDRLERDFKQSEEKFSTVVRESLDVILVLDPEDYRILTVNPTITPVLGYADDAVTGQSAAVFLPPDSEVTLDDLAVQSAPEEDLITTLDVVKADGTLCPTDVTATMIPWEDDQAILVTLRDITERRRREEELRQYREHLEELVEARTAELEAANQRLYAYTEELEASNAELDAFAHTVAHDLKGPIAIISGFSSLLVERAPRWAHEKIQDTSRRIKRTSEKMTNIIDELLLLASVRKQKDIEIGPLSMDRIMAEVRERLDEMIAEYHAEIIEPASWPVAAGYAPWIEEVWTNYLSNALKYGGKPPRVELGAAKITGDGEPPMIRFWIRDNGAGLTEEEQAQLFTQFTRLHLNQAQGHGLGLSIVQRIVTRLNGDVGVESEPGQGSTFYFTLPLLDELDPSSDDHHVLQSG